MKTLALFFILIGSVHASIKTEGDNVLPFQRKGYPLKDLVKDYAEALKISVSFPEGLLKNETSAVDLYIHQKTSFDQFSSLFRSLLDSQGYTLIQEKGYQWISEARDVRYLPSNIYVNEKHPNDERFVTVLYKLKHPIGSDITRNLRPFLSRYGRVVNFSDGRSIMLHEKGDNAYKLFEAIQFMDTEKVYKAALTHKPVKTSPEDDPLQHRIVELELKNKILEKKFTDESMGAGNVPNSPSIYP